MEHPQRYCSHCRKTKALNADYFKPLRDDGAFTTTCRDCLKQISEADARKKNSKLPDDGEKEEDDIRQTHTALRLSKIDLEAFLNTISRSEDVKSFDAFVNISSFHSDNLRESADKLAEAVWDQLQYRFTWVMFHSLNQWYSAIYKKN